MARQRPMQNQDQNGRPARNITGPQSALTDFLASHNISARQIRDDAELRRQQAAAQAEQNGEEVTAPVAECSSSLRRPSRNTTEEEKTKKKANEKKAIEKIKNTKAFKKRKKYVDDSDSDDEIARAIFESTHAPMPGQTENCGICGKRFTVTPYSLAGPDGGLLCAPCGKELAKEREGGQPKKKPRKQAGGVGSRRAMQSRILDGDVGTMSLATLCVHTLAKNVEMADSLGDLPDHLIDKIARLFSKRRLLKPETLPLFAQPTTETLHIYDGARLGHQDFISIFQIAPNLRRFKARCAIQFKDEVMDYLLSRDITLESFYLHGANLLSEEKWHEYFAAKGQALKGLQVYYTDNHFGDESIAAIANHCPNLLRLKVQNNQKLTNKGVEAIGELSSLEHLGLQLQNPTSSAAISSALSKIGHGLKTLSLKIVPDSDDNVLRAIHEHCRSLHKLRITDSEKMTDQGFVQLFTGWQNPPVYFLDLQKCRHIDSTRPRDNNDKVGLCGEGFKALMAHSGPKLEHLNVHACRHISREAFEEVFNDKAHYPELRNLEISFCEEVTDFILGCIFRACPKIKEVNVFGCMKVKEVRVPRGVILVGVPNAQGMVTEGMH
ncbi:DNA repair protein rhp7 [Tolypocladium ophioglossoides CBS 100239]|uniref:DNA repair protein rhp7 n=1 Tax=Tolypocladium ophioglossoides (strain CBS 100239) TaxID=1163406 RepID=A0A0L0NCP4_TOLOC|nr:DNA repair protein rhp7 [Tolypocladium ophioglossoides CBS 100239]